MQIQPTTVKAFTLTLTDSELRAAITNPQSLVSHFKAALNGAFDDEPATTAPKPEGKRGRPKGGKGNIKPTTPTSGPETNRCSVCGRDIAAKYMQVHMRKTHKNAATATSAQSHTAPVAAAA